MSRKKKTAIAVFIVLGIAVVGLAAGVYAKYIASLTGNNGKATVAKWAFEDDNKDGVVECDITGTYDAEKLVDGKIAPGTTGTCTIELSNKNSEVGVNYTIKLGDITNKPTNLIFKNGTTTLDGSSEITGFIAAGETADPIDIDWEWAYETTGGDDADTTDGKNAEQMAVEFDISGVQANPAN